MIFRKTSFAKLQKIKEATSKELKYNQNNDGFCIQRYFEDIIRSIYENISHKQLEILIEDYQDQNDDEVDIEVNF